MDYLGSLQHLDVPTLTTLVLVTAILAFAVYDPLVGHRQFSALLAGLDAAADDGERDLLRRRHYRDWTWHGWIVGMAAVAAVLALPGVGPAELGLRLPDLGVLLPEGSGEEVAGFVVGGIVGIALAAGILALLRRRLPRRAHPQSVVLDALTPTTPAARRGWAWLALSAGVTEEITYRGLVVLAVALAAPDLPRIAVVTVAAVLFGLAHWYQGRLGVLATGALGAVLTQLYLTTGSLLIPMLLHVLIDLRLALSRPAPFEAPIDVDAR